MSARAVVGRWAMKSGESTVGQAFENLSLTPVAGFRCKDGQRLVSEIGQLESALQREGVAVRQRGHPRIGPEPVGHHAGLCDAHRGDPSVEQAGFDLGHERAARPADDLQLRVGMGLSPG